MALGEGGEMKVWIVMSSEDWVGDTVVNVFNSEEKADDYSEKIKGRSRVDEWEVEE